MRDNGVGLPPGFSINGTSSLGLSIVRDLVGTQMGGTITMRSEGGTVVDVVVPVDYPTDDLASLRPLLGRGVLGAVRAGYREALPRRNEGGTSVAGPPHP